MLSNFFLALYKTVVFLACSLLLGIFIFIIYFVQVRKKAYDTYNVELNKIEAFTKKPSFKQGETIDFYIHAEYETKAEVFRLDTVLIPAAIKINITKKEQSKVFSVVHGFNWEKSVSIKTTSLQSGYYVLRINTEEGNKFYDVPFIVSPKTSGAVSVVASTNTWQAYNEFGGKSNYVDRVTPSLVKKIYQLFPQTSYISYLPYARPYSWMKKFPLGSSSQEVIDTVHSGKYIMGDDFNEIKKQYKPLYDTIHDGSYRLTGEWNLLGFLSKNKIAYNAYSDDDVQNDNEIWESKAIIFHVHSEYWSQEMAAKLLQYLNRGGKVIFASGNNIYREVESYEWGIRVVNQEIEREIPLKIAGTYYSQVTYPKTAPYEVLLSLHWIFNGTNVNNHQVFGRCGASGGETDKCWFTNDTTTQILAIGKNETGPAYMVYKEFNRRGWMFNASSITFTKSLSRDKVIDKMMLNLISNATAGPVK